MTERPGTAGALSDLLAIVSGASGGIGGAIVHALVRSGARVVGLDASPPDEPVPGVAHEELDLRDAGAVAGLAARFGPGADAPDVVVAAHGLGVHGRLAEGDPDAWASVVDANLVGTLRLLRAVLPRMLEAGRGDVVVVSSLGADRVFDRGGPYTASKAGLEQAIAVLRHEVSPPLRVTSIAPGIVDTRFFARSPGHVEHAEAIGQGSLEPDDVARAVLFALHASRGVAIDRIELRPLTQRF